VSTGSNPAEASTSNNQGVEYVPIEPTNKQLIDEIAEAGRLEVLGEAKPTPFSEAASLMSPVQSSQSDNHTLDLTPFRIAYAKLPYLLRSRRYHQSHNAT
ncbi:MAG: hypothetical protein ACREF7_04285, partial [Candidatus Saccharimonadales bacterium]